MSVETSSGASPLDRFDRVGYRVYRRLFDPDDEYVTALERKLTQAAVAEPVEMYLSRALAVGLVLGVACAVLAVPVALAVSSRPDGGLAAVTWGASRFAAGAVVGGAVAGLVVVASVARLYLVAGTREREIDYLLPDAVSYMYALSTGGLNEVEIVEAMAEADDTYGEVAREFQRIVRETRYFDVDHRTAIREQALLTPSDDLAEFLTDMLSIVNTGGDLVDFLDDKTEKHMRAARHRQEETLATLELFGELYIALSLFPLLLIIVLVIMGVMGAGRLGLLYATVYGLIPIGNLGFLVLVSMVKRDDPGDGYIATPRRDGADASEPATGDDAGDDDGPLAAVAGTALAARVRRRERAYGLLRRVTRPHAFFRAAPLRVLWLTVPATLLALGYAVLSGTAPTSWAGLTGRPVAGTVYYLYLPVYANALPLAVFYEWNRRSRRPITGTLSDTLRKLSSANDTGLSLLESIATVAETSSGKLGDELAAVCARVRYGTNLQDALIEFNNDYHIPRLARTVKLIAKAQETSNRITGVLTTAARASENQDELERERRSRTRLQVVVIVMTYLTMLAVLVVLKTQFLSVMAEVMASSGSPVGVGDSLSAGADGSSLSLLLLHAVAIQAVLSGLIAGYIREANLLAGLKYVVALSTVALAAWVVVG